MLVGAVPGTADTGEPKSGEELSAHAVGILVLDSSAVHFQLKLG